MTVIIRVPVLIHARIDGVFRLGYRRCQRFQTSFRLQRCFICMGEHIFGLISITGTVALM